MKTIIKKWKQQYGYEPSFAELYSHYTQGNLMLTDKEENEILKTYETIN
jgi:hypothetical protein